MAKKVELFHQYIRLYKMGECLLMTTASPSVYYFMLASFDKNTTLHENALEVMQSCLCLSKGKDIIAIGFCLFVYLRYKNMLFNNFIFRTIMFFYIFFDLSWSKRRILIISS